MRFDLDGETGWGIFEFLIGGQGYPRYPNWRAMDMSAFTQDTSPVERLPADSAEEVSPMTRTPTLLSA